MCAFIKKKRATRADRMNRNGMLYQFVRERLLHIQQERKHARFFVPQSIKDFDYVGRIGNGAIEIRC